MKFQFPKVDVVIVGAGTTGAATALLCARRGLSVLCLERATLADAGAHWANGVSTAAFDMAGIERPRSPELLASGADFHLIAGWGPQRLVLQDHDLMEVDMRRLVKRLQREAQAAGALLIDQVHISGFDGVSLLTSAGPVAARWVIDASGLSGARLLNYPGPHRNDICAAAQQVCEVSDADAARRFCEKNGANVGDTICFSGIEGGYSVLNIRVELGAHNRVAILTGSIPALGHRSGRAILREFVDQHDWVGPMIFGGARAIPLRRPYARLYRGNVAAIGEAACQVFAAHGSGIGAGLLAARLLADALADGRGLAGYEQDWQRNYGGLFAGCALFREFAQALSPADLSRLMTTGLMDADMVADGLEQRMPQPSARAVFTKLRATLRAPDLAVQLAPVLGGMAGVTLLYASFPTSQSHRPGWSRLVNRLLRAQA